MLKKIGKQAYRLVVPKHWRIHPVFSITQLEPAPEIDPFHRPKPTHPGSFFVEGDTNDLKSYEVEKDLNRRVIPKGRGFTTEYLIRWLGYGPEFDQWYNVKHLSSSQDLIASYESAMTELNDFFNFLKFIIINKF